MVPLYVRNTLEEKEGTSLQGDPCKEELAQDRRYSHYLGRPLVRFNPAVPVPSHLGGTSSGIADDDHSEASHQTDISADPFSLATLSPVKHGSSVQKLDKQTRKEMKKAQEEVRHLPLTNSLVRLVFSKAEPDLRDLKYLDEY